jgi:sugar/nucleoside kinase (ribokinase family)
LSTEGFSPLQKNIIITDWWNWTYIFDWKNKKTIPASNIKAIDTNWAWDVFRGAYVWGLLQKWETEKIVEFANKVAWLQCLKKW